MTTKLKFYYAILKLETKLDDMLFPCCMVSVINSVNNKLFFEDHNLPDVK